MAARLRKTTADYLAIAVSPVLIMTMVGSLTWFLVAAFYDGRYVERVTWILGMFVMAIVCVARISIEEGKERAGMFGLPLAAVTALAIVRFGGVSIVAFLLLGLIWWAAHKITWDCTVIDDQEDASGEGLLKTAGLDSSGEVADDAEPELPEPEGTTVRAADWESLRARWKEHRKRKHAPGVWVLYFSLAALPIFGIGQKFLPGDVASRQHAFWLVVVYVASALALLVSSSFLGLRRYLRQRNVQMPERMAVVWVGGGVAMILVLLAVVSILPRPGSEFELTSLSLDIEWPERQSSRFSVGDDGADKNRPGTEQNAQGTKPQEQPSSSQPGGRAPGGQQSGSPQQETSPETSRSDDAGSTDPADAEQASGDGQSGGQSSDEQALNEQSSGEQSTGEQSSGSSSSGQDASGGQSSDEQSSGGQTSGGQSSGGSSSEQESSNESSSSRQQSESERSGSESSSDTESGQRSSDAQPSGDRESESAEAGEAGDENADREEASDDSGEEEQTPSADRQTRSAAADESTEADESEQSPEETTEGEDEDRSWNLPKLPLPSVGNWFQTLLKLALWAAILLGVVWYVWKNWEEFKKALGEILQSLRDFWASLFGGKPTAAVEAEADEILADIPVYRRFSEFANPFLVADVAQTPEAIVKHTFAALEAWSRERGCPRHPEQTPREFARRLAEEIPSIAEESRRLADLVTQAAYAPGTLASVRAEPLETLWRKMEQGQASVGRS